MLIGTLDFVDSKGGARVHSRYVYSAVVLCVFPSRHEVLATSRYGGDHPCSSTKKKTAARSFPEIGAASPRTFLRSCTRSGPKFCHLPSQPPQPSHHSSFLDNSLSCLETLVSITCSITSNVSPIRRNGEGVQPGTTARLWYGLRISPSQALSLIVLTFIGSAGISELAVFHPVSLSSLG